MGLIRPWLPPPSPRTPEPTQSRCDRYVFYRVRPEAAEVLCLLPLTPYVFTQSRYFERPQIMCPYADRTSLLSGSVCCCQRVLSIYHLLC